MWNALVPPDPTLAGHLPILVLAPHEKDAVHAFPEMLLCSSGLQAVGGSCLSVWGLLPALFSPGVSHVLQCTFPAHGILTFTPHLDPGFCFTPVSAWGD